MIWKDPESGKLFAVSEAPTSAESFQALRTAGKAREVADTDSFTTRAIERRVNGALPGLAEVAAGVSKIPGVGGVAEMLVPQTPTDVGILAGTALMGPAGLALRGVAPALSRAIAPAATALAPSLSAGSRWLGRLARTGASTLGGATGAALGGEDPLVGAGKGAVAGTLGEVLGKGGELTSRWLGRPVGVTSWRKEGIEATDLNRLKDALAKVLPESAQAIKAAKDKSELSNLFSGKNVEEAASTLFGDRLGDVEQRMLAKAYQGQTRGGEPLLSISPDLVGGKTPTLREAIAHLIDANAHVWQPMGEGMRSGASVPMSLFQRNKLRNEIMSSIKQYDPDAATLLDTALRHKGKANEMLGLLGKESPVLTGDKGFSADALRQMIGKERLAQLEKNLAPDELDTLMRAGFRSPVTPWQNRTLSRDLPKPQPGSPSITEAAGVNLPGPWWARLSPKNLLPRQYIGDLPPQLRVGGYPTTGLGLTTGIVVNAGGRSE